MNKNVVNMRFNEILEILKEKLRIKNAILRKLENEELITVAYFGYGEEEANIIIKIGRGVTGLTALRNKTIVINDLDNYKGEYIKGISNAKSEVCIPIRDKDNKVIGTFNIESEIPNNFTKEKVDFLESIALMLSNVLKKENSSENKVASMNLAKSLAVFEKFT
ncbi:MAG TPA: GAF domain-containing protein [Spirochaetota bacterium]|nr:GAF domain-containing protein [Spirochaetota bacterium]HOL57829.1 GAF domain-containing protein [Spirochaetota bacterium]HPP05397.1 GAF domain-containing protein [Spirochaetota bacterium]